MSMDDLSYLEALMGGGAEASGSGTGGVWVVNPDGALPDGILRLIGKARVVADTLGCYVYFLACGSATADEAQRAIQAGADSVLLATGAPTLDDLRTFFVDKAPQGVLFPDTAPGRVLGPGLAQALGGSLSGRAADLAVDPIYQRILAHQPVLDDAARQVVALLASPAIAVVDTDALPAAFNEPWRTGNVEETGLSWARPVAVPAAKRPDPASPVRPAAVKSASIVVAAGLGLNTEAGVALAGRLAEALGGCLAGDVSALDNGWIAEDQLIGLTGHSIAPRLLLALGIDGDTSFFMATQEAGSIVAVQVDPRAPIVPVADYNIIADPAEFAEALLAVLGE